MLGEKAKWELHKNAAYCFEQILEAVLYCHVISHGDDRNKINTILPLEWTVATRQKSDRKERM